MYASNNQNDFNFKYIRKGADMEWERERGRQVCTTHTRYRDTFSQFILSDNPIYDMIFASINNNLTLIH